MHISDSKFQLSVVLSSFLILLLVSVLRNGFSLNKFFEMQNSRDILSQVVSNLELQVKDREDEIEKIRSSKDYALKILRERYHLLEKGESIFFFSD